MADSAENLAELFFAKLKTTSNAGVVLAQFYGALLNTDVGRSEVIMLNKLVKLFGKNSVFFSIIDISRKESFPEFPYGLLFKICKTKLETTTQADVAMSSRDNLERMITETLKEILKVKKIDPDRASKYLEIDNDERIVNGK